MPAADRVAGDRGDHRLRRAADLDVEVADVEAADALAGDLVGADVAVVAADRLIAAGAEGLIAGAGEDDRADVEVVAGLRERVAELGQGRRPEGVATLGAVDRDPRDPVADVVEDVLVVAGALPLDRGVEVGFGRGVLVAFGHRLAVSGRGSGAPAQQCRQRYPAGDRRRPSACTKHRQTGSTTAPGPTRTRIAAGRGRRGARLTRSFASEAGSVAAALADAGRRHRRPGRDRPPGRASPHAVALHGAILAGAVVQSMPPDGREGVDVAAGTDFLDAGVRSSAPAHGGSRGRPSAAIRRCPLTRVLSSGTSGAPKPVLLTAGNHLWSALGTALNLGVERDDRWLCCLPLNHVGGLTILLRSAIYGTARRDPSRLRRRARRRALEDGADQRRLAGPDPARPAARCRRRRRSPPAAPDRRRAGLGRGARGGARPRCDRRPDLRPDRGLLAGLHARPRPRRPRRGRLGRPAAARAPRSGSTTARSSSAGPTVAPAALAGTAGCTPATSAASTTTGYLWVEGRRDDLIVSGGENVRPDRVEAALLAHPAVAEVAVAGREDRRVGAGGHRVRGQPPATSTPTS